MKAVLSVALGVFLSAGLIGQEFRLGSPVTDFTVSNFSGAPVNFSSLRGDLTVLMFVATQCPVSNAYNDRMKAVYNEYAAKGVKFVAINSNGTEPADEVRLHAATHSFPFAVYKDVDNVVADRFGAQVTPETFVIGKSGDDPLPRLHRRLAEPRQHQDAGSAYGAGRRPFRTERRPGRDQGVRLRH